MTDCVLNSFSMVLSGLMVSWEDDESFCNFRPPCDEASYIPFQVGIDSVVWQNDLWVIAQKKQSTTWTYTNDTLRNIFYNPVLFGLVDN